MGRRSSRPSGGRRAAPARAPARSSSRAPSRSASSMSRPAPPPAPRRAASTAPAGKKTSPAPPPATQQPQQGSAMGGFMANVASTGLGVMAGRAMDRALFGGSGSQPAPEEMPPAADGAYEYGAAEEHIPETVCAREALEFKKCMERTGSDVASCQWNLDILAACQRQQEETGFADAGRL